MLASLQPSGPPGRRAHLVLPGGRAEGLEEKGPGRTAEGARLGRHPSPTRSPEKLDASRCKEGLRARPTRRALATRAGNRRESHCGYGHSGRDWLTCSRRPNTGGERPARRVDGRAHVPGRITRREGQLHPRPALRRRTGRHGVECAGLMFIDRMLAGAQVRCLGRMSAQGTIIPSRNASSGVEPPPAEETRGAVPHCVARLSSFALDTHAAWAWEGWVRWAPGCSKVNMLPT